MECSEPDGKTTHTDAINLHHKDICLSPIDFQNLALSCKPKVSAEQLHNFLLSRHHSPDLLGV